MDLQELPAPPRQRVAKRVERPVSLPVKPALLEPRPVLPVRLDSLRRQELPVLVESKVSKEPVVVCWDKHTRIYPKRLNFNVLFAQSSESKSAQSDQCSSFASSCEMLTC